MYQIWKWTNEYQLEVSNGGVTNGSVNSGVVNNWYTNGVAVTGITATASNGYGFYLWTGDVPAGSETNNPLTVTMDQARTITANFYSEAGETKIWNGTGIWESSTNWTPPGMPGPCDNAILGSGAALLSQARTVRSLTVSNPATLTFTNWSTTLTVSNVAVLNGGKIKHAANSATTTNAFGVWVPDARVYIVCTNLTVDAGGEINADACGYKGATEGSASLAKGPGGGAYASGGSYGGQGGSWGTYFAGSPYDLANAPTNPGSGGGGDGSLGTAGGGVVRVEASGNVAIHGTLTANGGNGTQGTGSGGGIFIGCQGAFSGSTGGVIRANGGDTSAGAGGGGRIAVICANLANAKMRFSASPGLSGYAPLISTNVAGMGTLYFPDTGILSTNLDQFEGRIIIPGFTAWNVASLAVSNGAIGLGDGDVRLTVTNDLVIGTGGALMLGCLALRTGVAARVSGAVTNLLAVGGAVLLQGGELTIGGLSQTSRMMMTVGGDLTLTNAGRMYVHGGETNANTPDYGTLVAVTGNIRVAASSWICPCSHPTNGGSVLFRTGDLTVLAGGGFDADARGFAQGYGPGTGQGLGIAGGGYGGKGGAYRTDSPGGQTYGSLNEPSHPGSGSGPYFDPNWPGSAGGGLIRVEAARHVTIQGTLTANSWTPSGGFGNVSGSGGGIFIICEGVFSGGPSGVICAQGSDASNGAGGGGRIAVWNVPAKIRHRYLGNTNDNRAVLILTNWPGFGTISANRGTTTAYPEYNPPHPYGAYPGTCCFFQYVKGATLGVR